MKKLLKRSLPQLTSAPSIFICPNIRPLTSGGQNGQNIYSSRTPSDYYLTTVDDSIKIKLPRLSPPKRSLSNQPIIYAKVFKISKGVTQISPSPIGSAPPSGKISDLPNAVEEQRLKLNAFFKHLVSLIKTVRDIPGSIEQDQRDIDEIDHIHLHAINAIQNFLGL
uniref:Uncharacterized protein n=1 Tax=Oryza glumipatula TaxID=40148 RepID=A0A0D9ZGM6_9ORYZ